ncbi:protocadherin Fat 4-like [Liolophura sinensis]|uniref:protocadherin Fat 4-like n=1 Tax=Liolophura sinensis TaxID=3198878 RepID=UPI00315828AE
MGLYVIMFSPYTQFYYVNTSEYSLLTAVLHYDIIDPSRRFRINSDTGILTLKISLKNADDLEFSVVIVVSDGLMESNMTLVISVSQKNFSPPAFKPDVYTVEVKETVPPGTFVEIVFADDDEGDWITYYIEEGNVDGMFHIDSVTGEIMTRYHLDVQLNANFTLKIVAKDDHDDDMTSMTGRATVYITVLPVNQHAPSFTEGEIIHASILEDAAKGTVVQLPDAYDEDGDNIQYSLLGSSDLFSVNPHDSDLHLLEVIDRETTPTVALTLVASDNGNPPKSSHTSVVIDVLDVNDNPPILQHLDDIIKVTQSAIRLKIPVHKVIAIDPDSGNNAALTYSLTMDTPLLRIDDSGAIYCKAECLTLNASITLPIVINVQDKGHPPQGTSNTTTLHVIVSPGTSDVNVTEEDAYSLEPSPSVAFQRALSGHIPFSEETPMHRFTAAELDFTEVISSFATPMEELTQTAVSPTASLPLLFQTTSAIMDQPTAMPSESTSTQLTSTRALPTAALPLSSYKEICQRPIDAVIRDTAGVFFFQDNYIYRVFEGRRLVVRGYPKSIRRIFSGWRKQKISGPINAAVHSEASGYTYLFKEAKIWVFLMSRLVEIAELESPVDLVLDAAIDLPGVGILLIKGSDVYRLTDEEKFTLSGPEPLESLLPGAPLPLDGAFVSTDQKTIHLFSGDLAYDWNVEDKTLSEESPIHITEWMDCEL